MQLVWREGAVMVVSVRPEVAFQEFVAARSASLFRTALLLVGDHQLAQDLLQESLVKTYVAWSRLRDVANAEAYTRRVIVTTSISWRRRRSTSDRSTRCRSSRRTAVATWLTPWPAGPTSGRSCRHCPRSSGPPWCCATARTCRRR